MEDLYGQLEAVEDVLHFGLKDVRLQLATGNPHLVGEENHLQAKWR